MYKGINFIKKFLFIGIVIFIATFFAMYWSMAGFSNKMSSACLECGFFEEVILMSLITAVLFSVLFLIITIIKNKIIEIIIQFLLLITVWLFWNYNIFVNRESSWSTYLFNEEIYYVVSMSCFPIIVLSIISIFVINYKKVIKQNI